MNCIMASRNLSDLHPDLQPLAREFLRQCTMRGLDVLVTCTYRSGEEQDALYAQGRTRPGAIVTNARAGQSAHNFTLRGYPASLAFDIVPLRHGKPVWGLKGNGIDDDPSDDERDDLELWQRCRAIAEGLGMESASRWRSFPEWPHFQVKGTDQIMKVAAA